MKVEETINSQGLGWARIPVQQDSFQTSLVPTRRADRWKQGQHWWLRAGEFWYAGQDNWACSDARGQQPSLLKTTSWLWRNTWQTAGGSEGSLWLRVVHWWDTRARGIWSSCHLTATLRNCYSAPFLFFIQFETSIQGMGPLIFRVALPTSI